MSRFVRELTVPGGRGWIAKTLDYWAARRVRQAIIDKTDDALTVRWLGRSIWQYPLDAWILQEVIGELKPDIIVETGTWLGGSAYFFACLCDLLNHGEVISIDVAAEGTIEHPRITYLQGSSVDQNIVTRVGQRMRRITAQRVLIVLDSDHSAHHVSQELEAYSPLVPLGSYIHVQDGTIDELPLFREGRPGPLVAIKAFLKKHPQFTRDTDIEWRYVVTEHPYGWLKRTAID